MNTDFLKKNHKGETCNIKPVTCQEGYCNGCQIYLDWLGHQRSMGREATPDWLADWEKEQADKLSILKVQIEKKRDDAFNESLFGSLEHQLQLQSMVNAYDVVLSLIKKALGGKG